MSGQNPITNILPYMVIPKIVIPKRNTRFAPHIPPRGGIKKGGISNKTNWNY